jgi:hypothetical protein
LTEPRERVRLAQWCQSQGLKQRAVEEAEAALALKPQDRSLKRFRDDMRAFAAFVPETVTRVVPELPLVPVAPAKSENDPILVEVSPESLGLFVTKVQPILINACAKCHSGDYNGKFKLNVAMTQNNKKAMQVNLAAVSALIDRQQLASSPLLTRAVSVHGNSGVPPLKDRQTAAYKHLDDWVHLATGQPLTPSAPPAALPAAIAADSLPLLPPGPPARPNSFASDPSVKPAAATTKPGDVPLPVMPKEPESEPDKPKPGDPFDPAIFNQTNKPKKP